MKKSLHYIYTAFFGSLFICIAWANPTLSAGEFSSEWDSREFAEVRLISGTSGIGNGIGIKLGLEFLLKPDWKIYWRSPGDAGSPPVIDASQSANLSSMEMKWPQPKRFDEGNNLTTVGYQNQVVFPISAKTEDPLKPLELRFGIDYQVCKTICIPVSTNLALMIPPGTQGPTKHSQIIERFETYVPVPAGDAIVDIDSVFIPATANEGTLIINITRKTPFIDPAIFLEGQTPYRFGMETTSLTNSSLTAEFAVPISNIVLDNIESTELLITLADVEFAEEISHLIKRVGQPNTTRDNVALLSILFTALIGGLILNLMPCVLPVLSIKILSVLQNIGQSRLKIRLSFLASVCGILFSYLLLALGTILLRTLGTSVGWGMQFQEPLFLAALILILTVFACNLFGFFEIGTPSYRNNSLGSGDKKGNWLSQSFFTGAFATLMATPCSAPFVGTSISFALSRGAIEIFLIFGTLGVGMAMPYLLLAASPNLVARLPRPGKWMIQLRVVLGVVLVATTAWLLSILSDQTSLELGVSIGTIAVACGLVLKFTASIMANRKIVLRALTLAVGGCSMIALIINTSPDGEKRESFSNSKQSGWIELDEEKISKLVESGKIVFVDITADWCLTCKINKKLILDSTDIITQLSSSDVVRMRGDWTKRNVEIQNYLFSFNRFGIPFNAVYGVAAPTGIVLPELLRKTDISLALELARGETNFTGN